jgi:hypothetical protein
MRTVYKKLQTHEKQLFLRSRVMAECHTTSQNILHNERQEFVVIHMGGAQLAYMRCIQTNNRLRSTPCCVLKG